MGKRGPGLARTQHLVQNLARELQLQGSTVASTKSKVIEVTGSGAGAKIELECIEALVWRVNATLSSSGTPSSIATIYAG